MQQIPRPRRPHASRLWRGTASRWTDEHHIFTLGGLGSTGKGILIGVVSAFASAALVALIIALVYFFRHTRGGRIFLDRLGRPGEFDDEQQLLRDEEDALADMDEMQRAEYLRAKAFVQANPPESMPTDISLSQFLAIQEKGVSAWEFEPELEIANCFVEARTEIEFFDAECSVQSNLPMPKQNDVYYWEAKLFDKPDSTLIHIGLTTKPYPLFRLPGLHKYSIAYSSTGDRRYNQPFRATAYGPSLVQGDVVGVGYRPRTGTIFFTRNGKKLDDVAHGLKAPNFFPTVGATGPCNVSVNFGQMGFVFIEANVKKWGLAPMTGSLAPPPPYGSEAGSILLEGGREGLGLGLASRASSHHHHHHPHGRSSSAQIRLSRAARTPRSPGFERSPTDISLAHFNLMDAVADDGDAATAHEAHDSDGAPPRRGDARVQVDAGAPMGPADPPPPGYESPEGEGRREEEDDDGSTPRGTSRSERRSPPIPSYEAATGDGHGRAA